MSFSIFVCCDINLVAPKTCMFPQIQILGVLQLTISHQLASLESIREILVIRYTCQLLHEMYKVGVQIP